MLTPDFPSEPVVQPQPDREFYGINDLAKFRVWNREEYEAQHGPAEPFDPARRPKTWFDSTVDVTDPEAEVAYLIVRTVNEVPRIEKIHMPAWEARSLNFANKGEAPTRPYREVPVRPLLPNEALVAKFGPSVSVVRMDLRFAEEQNSGNFLPEDRATAKFSVELLQRIAAKLGV